VFADPVGFLLGCLFLIPALLIAIPVHEFGHGLAAVVMGDPSPRNRGYLRPQPPQFYLNAYGVVAVFLANVGWGRPVPVNEYRLQGRLRRVGWILGGPAANLLVAIAFGILLRALVPLDMAVPSFGLIMPPEIWLIDFLYAIYFLNLAVFAFQLLPVPGLDGWRIVEALFRERNPRFFFDVSANIQTIWVVCILVVVGTQWLLRLNLLGWAVAIFFEPASRLIFGQCTGYTALFPCLPSVLF
jgi:Zn-dependent protease